MSETPDISMDLLELEDAVPPPYIGSVFLEEEGEEESPREADDVVWTPFLGRAVIPVGAGGIPVGAGIFGGGP